MEDADESTVYGGLLVFAQTVSVTRLVDFYKFLATNWLTKVAQIFWSLLG